MNEQDCLQQPSYDDISEQLDKAFLVLEERNHKTGDIGCLCCSARFSSNEDAQEHFDLFHRPLRP